MRIGILTSHEYGTASHCLPTLATQPSFSLVGAIVAAPVIANRRRHFLRKLYKVWRIGLLGALNGLRLRKWYQHETPPLAALADQHKVPIFNFNGTNSRDCRECMRDLKLDLAISLGNPYIAPGTFNIPKNGMLNVHGELLPEFPGAQSVIWAIYEQVALTGFSIHQVSKVIDGGQILYRFEQPIKFGSTLVATVQQTVEEVRQHVPLALAKTIDNYPRPLTETVARKPKRHTYTTPSYWEFRRMVRNNQHMFRQYNQLTALPQAKQS